MVSQHLEAQRTAERLGSAEEKSMVDDYQSLLLFTIIKEIGF